ncbi:hypothetical protein NQ314_004483 [Rhamnusium bicolor]|uniref:Protein sleepless n=1 Tax=Rhamnusium bicolor TaxID=1586634 RepID=A0AAV8ZLS1_9CUCU|nr:hypothetical protein NQ314_004483 [Rhamnusium bicolor]
MKSNLINGTERDCASQKQERQNYYNEKWHAEFVIEDPYEEGCAKVNDKGARTTTTEHCYCKGDLCNSARRLGDSHFNILSAVISLILIRFLCSSI